MVERNGKAEGRNKNAKSSNVQQSRKLKTLVLIILWTYTALTYVFCLLHVTKTNKLANLIKRSRNMLQPMSFVLFCVDPPPHPLCK